MYHHHHRASLCSWASEAQVPKEVHRVRGRGGHGLADQLGRHRLVGLWWKGHWLDTFVNTTDTFAFVLLLNLVFSLWRRCSWAWAPVTAVIHPIIERQRRMDSTKTAYKSIIIWSSYDNMRIKNMMIIIRKYDDHHMTRYPHLLSNKERWIQRRQLFSPSRPATTVWWLNVAPPINIARAIV